MDGVIAVFWTDLDPGKVTDCPQTHHCGGGGNVSARCFTDGGCTYTCTAISRHLITS